MPKGLHLGPPNCPVEMIQYIFFWNLKGSLLWKDSSFHPLAVSFCLRGMLLNSILDVKGSLHVDVDDREWWWERGKHIEWLDPQNDASISFWNSMFPWFSLSWFSRMLEVDDISLSRTSSTFWGVSMLTWNNFFYHEFLWQFGHW